MRSLCCTPPVFSFHFLLLLNSLHGEFNHLSVGSWGWFWKDFFCLTAGSQGGRQLHCVCVCVWSPTMHTHAETHHHMIQGQRAACLQRNLTWVLFLFQLLKAKRLKAVKTEEAEKSRKWAEIKDLMNYSRFSADLHQINVKTFKISLIVHTVQIKKKKKTRNGLTRKHTMSQSWCHIFLLLPVLYLVTSSVC